MESSVNSVVPEVSTPKSLGRYVPVVARVLLGLVFFAFGLVGLLNLMPPPQTPIPEGAAAFGGALMKTGYMFPLIKGAETLAGAMLLSNRFVPLALAILAPVLVNIVAFHAFLQPSGVVIPAVLLVIEVYLAWSYRKAFLPMLAARVTPNA